RPHHMLQIASLSPSLSPPLLLSSRLKSCFRFHSHPCSLYPFSLARFHSLSITRYVSLSLCLSLSLYPTQSLSFSSFSPILLSPLLYLFLALSPSLSLSLSVVVET